MVCSNCGTTLNEGTKFCPSCGTAAPVLNAHETEFLNGKGMEAVKRKDYSEAFTLFSKAAESGNKAAQNNLANLYQNGLGVPQDLTKAAEWYSKAERAVPGT